MICKRALFLLVLLISCLQARSQTAGTGINSIISSVDTLRSRMPAEKLYIQFDKPYYSTGDTIWLKAYLFDAAFLQASEKSGIVYLELANDTNKVLLRRMLPLAYGIGMGNIVLNKDDAPEGSYTIRAYTNLMRNFGEDLVFRKSFYVSGSSAQNWLVNSKSMLSRESGKDNLRLDLQFNQLNKDPLREHDLELRVLDGKKVLLRDKVQTDIDGKLDVNFNLPEKADGKNISIVAVDPKDDTHKMTIPIPVNRPENTDVQFMPEGGNLVNGITSKIGFKAIGEDGKGVEVSGKVYSGSSSQEVAVFNSSYKGMGSFELTPKEGETYTAKVVLNGTTKDFPLPAVKSNGTSIRVNNSKESDSIEVIVSSNLPANAIASYYLLAQSRGIVCYGAVIRFTGNPVNKKKIAKSLFPTGIARFTLMSADRQPLNERIIYINHKDQLNIIVKAGKGSYQARDSITLAIEVKDHEDKPVQGSFSLSVTDNSQVRIDSLSNNILTSLLLTNDLKGTVEDPGHYLQETTQAVTPARMTRSDGDLDHLLLTQGWIGYNWKDVFNPPVPQYSVEPEFMVRGKVSNVFNKGSASTSIWLFSSDPAFIKTGNTDKDGSFLFSDFPVTDTLSLFLQARNKKEKSFNVGITMDEFKTPVFKTDDQRFMPWYVNSDTSLLKYVKTNIEQKQEQLKLSGVNVLSEVTITAKKIINGSKNLNGPGEADQAIDKKELQKVGKVTLLQLLQQQIKGFNEGGFPKKSQAKLSYRINEKEMHLVIDGFDVEKFYSPLPTIPRYDRDRYDFIKGYLDFFTAEDIQGIEVMYNSRYNFKYNVSVLSAKELIDFIDPIKGDDFAYIEVTTTSGNGVSMKKIPGTYTYKPMPFILPKQFYSPKYAVKQPVTLTDLRSTIHWEPNIVTDKDGKGFVSFYSADRVGTYSIIMEGSDMNGNIGRQTGVIIVN